MWTLYESILSLCQETEIKGGKMCVDLGLSKSLMTDLKSGRKKGITAETAQKIADYFSVSVDRVLNGPETKKAPTQKGEREIDDRKMKAAFLGRIFLTAARVCGICQKNKKSEIAIKNSALQLQIADEIADENPPPFLEAGSFIF